MCLTRPQSKDKKMKLKWIKRKTWKLKRTIQYSNVCAQTGSKYQITYTVVYGNFSVGLNPDWHGHFTVSLAAGHWSQEYFVGVPQTCHCSTRRTHCAIAVCSLGMWSIRIDAQYRSKSISPWTNILGTDILKGKELQKNGKKRRENDVHFW